jgi:predicted SAM-dependent methyltransferase
MILNSFNLPIVRSDLMGLPITKLNLGCGTDIKTDFLNLDIRPLDGVDIVCDIQNLYFIKDNSVEELLAYDVLEHFTFLRTSEILKHWISKLAPKGTIIIRVPDLEKILNKLVNYQLPVFEAQRLVFGGQDYPENFHMAGFSEGMLEGLLLGCGCSEVIQVVREDDSHNVTLVARK